MKLLDKPQAARVPLRVANLHGPWDQVIPYIPTSRLPHDKINGAPKSLTPPKTIEPGCRSVWAAHPHGAGELQSHAIRGDSGVVKRTNQQSAHAPRRSS